MFNAPRELVYAALTTPEHVRLWWGAGHGDVTTCDIDLRVGGRWRVVLMRPDGSEVPFSSEYIELDPAARTVQTARLEPLEGEPSTITTTLKDKDGVTTMRALCRCDSEQTRDTVIASGMGGAMNASYDAMEALLSELPCRSEALLRREPRAGSLPRRTMALSVS